MSKDDKIHLKCDVIDGSVVCGLRQPILYNFVSDKQLGYKIFCEAETIHYENIIASVLNTKTLDLEDGDHKEFKFSGEVLTFK